MAEILESDLILQKLLEKISEECAFAAKKISEKKEKNDSNVMKDE